MNGEAAGLRWTGHALVDVGVAGLCQLCGRDSPEDLTLADLDQASDFIAEHYFSGKLDPYLTVVFTNNSGYCGPNKVDGPEDYAEVFRAHRVPPQKHVDPKKHLAPATGQRCVFSGSAASAWVHRQHLPLFSGAEVMNFRPEGQTAVPIAGPYLVTLQFLPMAARRAEGRLLAVHADEPGLMIAFARRYLEDNKRLLELALPTTRAPVHEKYDREIPMWDAGKEAVQDGRREGAAVAGVGGSHGCGCTGGTHGHPAAPGSGCGLLVVELWPRSVARHFHHTVWRGVVRAQGGTSTDYRCVAGDHGTVLPGARSARRYKEAQAEFPLRSRGSRSTRLEQEPRVRGALRSVRSRVRGPKSRCDVVAPTRARPHRGRYR